MCLHLFLILLIYDPEYYLYYLFLEPAFIFGCIEMYFNQFRFTILA